MTRFKFAKFGNGYEVELDLAAGTENGTSCDISRGRFRASLAAMEATGQLESSNGTTHNVPGWVIGEISNWAYREGHM